MDVGCPSREEWMSIVSRWKNGCQVCRTATVMKNGCRSSVDGRMDVDCQSMVRMDVGCQSMEEWMSIAVDGSIRRMDVKSLDCDEEWMSIVSRWSEWMSAVRQWKNGCRLSVDGRMDVDCPSMEEWMSSHWSEKNGCQLSVDGRMDVDCQSIVGEWMSSHRL